MSQTWSSPAFRNREDLPLVTIVVVFRKDHDRLAGTLPSIAAIASPALEVVVIEGDSDASLRSIEQQSYLAGQSVVARWKTEPDSGIYDAMNRGYSLASGEWIWFINAGDLVSPTLNGADLTDRLASQSSQWVVGGGLLRNPGSRDTRAMPTHDQVAFQAGKRQLCHQRVLMRRKFLESLGGFNLGYRVCSDYDLLLRASQVDRPGVIDLDIVVYEEGGFSAREAGACERENYLVRRAQLRRGKYEETLDWLRSAKRRCQHAATTSVTSRFLMSRHD